MWFPFTVFFLIIGIVNPLANAGDTDHKYHRYNYSHIKAALQKIIETTDSEKLKRSSQILLDRLISNFEPETSVGERGGPGILPSEFLDWDPNNPHRAFQLYCTDLEKRHREGQDLALVSREYETCRKYDMGKKGLPPETVALLSMLEDDRQVSTDFLESLKGLPQDSALQTNRNQCLKDHQRCSHSDQSSLICSGFLAACLVPEK